MSASHYSIDTSAFVHGFTRIMPPDVIPRLWETKLDEIIDSRALVSPYDVLVDLETKDDDLYAWAKARKGMFLELDQFEPELRMIMNKYPRLVDTKKNKSGSDPMVIALALAKDLTVVSEENGGSAKSPNMPFVCNELGIRYINFLTLVREQRWVF